MVLRLRSPENKKNIQVPQPVKPSDKKNNNSNKWKETRQKQNPVICLGALVYVLRFPGHPQDQKAFSDLRNWLEKKT